MSQKGTRKVVSEENEKRTESPVKDMKKKLAANAEKEKQAEKQVEKGAEKHDKSAEKADKSAEKIDKSVEKKQEKADKKQKTETETTDKKQADKKPEPADKKQDKADKKQEPTDKKHDKAEKKSDAGAEKKEESKKDDKAEKPSEKQEQKPPKAKQNGSAKMNGTGEEHNGAASAAEDDELDDEMFPELAYDETSDPEFEPDSTPRTLTRRSQSKDKACKVKDDVPSTDRKLRSSDSPKPDAKKSESKQEVEKKDQEKTHAGKKDGKENGDRKSDVEIVIDLDGDEEPRKTDTNFSKSRVKVSPYRRSLRLADSMLANYTGNNTTMEMDITESSAAEEPSLDDSSFLSGIRNIRGRRSYKLLKELPPRPRAGRPAASLHGITPVNDQTARPTGTVVGRKRKPESSDGIELATDAVEAETLNSHGKRMRLLDRLFKRSDSSQIVGINSDLPLTAPVASTETIDPESLKSHSFAPTRASQPEVAGAVAADKDSKKCIIM